MEIRRLVRDWTFDDLRAKIELAMTEGGRIDPSTLFRWHADRSAPRAMFAGPLLEVLDAESLAELGLGRTHEAARNFSYMTKGERKREVHRRKMLKGVGAASVARLLLPVSDLVASAQLLDGRKSISRDDVDSAQDTATQLAIAYRENPGANSVRAAKAHAYTLLDLLKSNRKTMDLATRAGLQAVASDAAALAGYGDMNAGRLDDADRWFVYALDLAREAGDRRLEALALAARAWRYSEAAGKVTADQEAGRVAFEGAATFQAVLRPAGRAYVYSYLSRQLAASGDDLSSGKMMEHARTAAALVPLDAPGWGWWSVHGELGGWESTRPVVFTAARELWLSRPADALQLFGQARDGITLPVRRVALLGDEMAAYAALGEVEQACVSAIAALDESKRHDLVVRPQLLVSGRRAFPPGTDTLPLVRELDERLRLAA